MLIAALPDSFVGTYMEDAAVKLMVENLSKNMSDADEYPAMMNMHTRCVSIIANFWGAQKGEKPIGTATTGQTPSWQRAVASAETGSRLFRSHPPRRSCHEAALAGEAPGRQQGHELA